MNPTEKLLEETGIPFEAFSICFSEEKYYKLFLGQEIICFVYHVDNVYSTKLLITGNGNFKFSYHELGYPESWFVKKHKNTQALLKELVELRDLIRAFKK